MFFFDTYFLHLNDANDLLQIKSEIIQNFIKK